MSWVKYKKALKLSGFNATVMGIIFNSVTWPLMEWRGCETGYNLPSFATTVWHLFCFIVVEEIFFYYGHRSALYVVFLFQVITKLMCRLLHHPMLYKHFHKIHHEWTAPTGITAIYAHPVEHIISNLLPVFLGPMIMGSHLAIAWLWVIVAILSTTISHSGYHFPFLPSPEAHDYHHLK